MKNERDAARVQLRGHRQGIVRPKPEVQNGQGQVGHPGKLQGLCQAWRMRRDFAARFLDDALDVEGYDPLILDHEYAMTVLTTVISRPTARRIVVDAGFKAMSSQHSAPEPLRIGAVRSLGLSAEHGRIELEQPADDPRVGDKLEFIVGYTDSTVVLHDVLYGVRDGCVEVAWPILGRGKLA